MRVYLLLGWLMIPVAVGAYHFGPGQHRLQLDQVSGLLRQADQHAQAERWQEAEANYEEALELLPPERVGQRRQVRLELAKTQMLVKKLPTAQQDLKQLVAEMEDDPAADPQVLTDSRQALANSQYYMTWLMRLEGRPREDWEPEIESARQTFRLLAEDAQRTGDEKALQRDQEDLESAIRLARMDLSDLQGLPLPSQ